MSRRYCSACRMIRSGVKTKIALEHSCGLERGAIPPPQTFKLPKYEPYDLIEVSINRTGVIDTGRATMVTLKKQTLLGIEIPHGIEVWIPGGVVINKEFSQFPTADVPGWKLNEVLRTMVIDKLKQQ